MKFNKWTLLLVAVLGLSLGPIGCVTNQSGKTVVDPVTAAKLAPVLQATASSAVVFAYSKDTNCVAYLDAVRAAVQEFALQDSLTPGLLQAKINALPIKALKTPSAQLVISPLLSIYQAFFSQYVQAGLSDNTGLRTLLSALVQGIADGQQSIKLIQESAASGP